jgi:ribonuclease Z
MRPSFHPRLTNPPFEDPGLFVPFVFEKRAILFDLGYTRVLSSRDLLKTDHVFVSHTHVDHFVGFDHMLRIFLGREKQVCLYGPEGFLKNVEGRLAGYSWNLVEHYENNLTLRVTEVLPGRMQTREYRCHDRFIPSGPPEEADCDGVLLREPALEISAQILDHGIPCLGFALHERFHVNVIKERLKEMGIGVGPWLKGFKQALFDRADLTTVIQASSAQEPSRKMSFALGELADRITLITPGQKIAYVTDASYTPDNAEKIVSLALNADHLYIEAGFLETEREMARIKRHLTAHQAGTLAGLAKVKQFSIFHFSPRYMGMEALLYQEADEAYTRNREMPCKAG